ncbi:hypothetical protein BOTBODRAFT_413923 [Botryobasidium botryosum FD-172 SS1]|uniref:Uncharacterized protein n=1 Tax=Botryobasidium botryosum (strain FD-172 SS1) TaxID=930990 RepID=A0A067MM18_BOTB1|nr:hypothetical protein BOTBODRAFT_413923 [Botryobasidium botryosum FD-172 SS1]
MAMEEGPTARDIYNDRDIRNAFQDAWDRSFPNRENCWEQGGYIYGQGERSTLKLTTREATPGDQDSQTHPVGRAMAIDLSNPPRVPGWTLVANFHTHPLSPNPPINGNPNPSDNDLLNAWDRQVPGFVIGRGGIITYGVNQRDDMRTPEGYPPRPAHPQGGRYNPKDIGRPPNDAPNDVNPRFFAEAQEKAELADDQAHGEGSE